LPHILLSQLETGFKEKKLFKLNNLKLNKNLVKQEDQLNGFMTISYSLKL